MLKEAYRTLSISTLVGKLGLSDFNILEIGSKNSWMLNTITNHRRHFIGTRQRIGLCPGSVKAQMLKRLELLVLRYASSGSHVRVYYLKDLDTKDAPKLELCKAIAALYQPPSCTIRCHNGIKTPSFVQCPIQADKLDYN